MKSLTSSSPMSSRQVDIPSSFNQPVRTSTVWLYHSTVLSDLPSDLLWTSNRLASLIISSFSVFTFRLRPLFLFAILRTCLDLENCLSGKQGDWSRTHSCGQAAGRIRLLATKKPPDSATLRVLDSPVLGMNPGYFVAFWRPRQDSNPRPAA